MSKKRSSDLTGVERLRRHRRGETGDPDAWYLTWRLRAILADLEAARQVAGRNQERWPAMAEELRQSYLLIVPHYEAAERAYLVACDQQS